MIKDTFPMIIGEEKVRSERRLLAGVEDGKNMMSADSVRFLVLHCSASRCNQDYSVEKLRRDHKARGFVSVQKCHNAPICGLFAKPANFIFKFLSLKISLIQADCHRKQVLVVRSTRFHCFE